MKKNEKRSSLGLYVHWPFCLSKCPYCDFNSHVRDSYDLREWGKALRQEISWARQQVGSSPVVKSIFFGGGTPSLMPPALVEELIRHICTLWGTEKDLEITLEANPTSAEARKFEAFAKAGVNRLSLGVQSFQDQELRFLGRAHTGAQAQEAIAWAKEFFPRFSFDLIYALPGQSVSDWKQTLEKALTFSPPHLSCYQLTYETGTAFYQRFLRGGLSYPTEDLAVALYKATESLLALKGLNAYEISNYAAVGDECRHNLLYWTYEDYIGIGPGAYGRLRQDDVKYALKNIKVPETWLANVAKNAHGLEEKLVLSEEEIFQEWLLMGLRLQEGVNLSRCQPLTGRTWQEWIPSALLTSLEEAGYLKIQGEMLILSSAGRLVSNQISQILMGKLCP